MNDKVDQREASAAELIDIWKKAIERNAISTRCRKVFANWLTFSQQHSDLRGPVQSEQEGLLIEIPLGSSSSRYTLHCC